MDQKLQLDIRIVKFQDYIRRKPNSPFGYYGLGVQYMLAGKTAMADKMFTHALKTEPGYTPAMLGKLEFLLAEKKFIAATRYYHKNRNSFERKKIYMKRIHHITSRLYLSRGFFVHSKRLLSIFVFGENFGALQKMFNNSTKNPVVNILLSMYLVKEKKTDERSRILYHLCVSMDGIVDKFRWDLVKLLSKENPAILQDDKIAGLFQSIPESGYRIDYLNFLLSCFIAQQDKEKILNAFSELQKQNLSPDKKVMWQYVDFCNSKNIYNTTITLYCQNLIEAGWVDDFIASTLLKLKNKGLVDISAKIYTILSLYGYNIA